MTWSKSFEILIGSQGEGADIAVVGTSQTLRQSRLKLLSPRQSGMIWDAPLASLRQSGMAGEGEGACSLAELNEDPQSESATRAPR